MKNCASTIPLKRVWISNAEAQTYLGVGPEFMRGLRDEAKLSFFKVGKTIFYRIEDIDMLIRKNKVI